MNTHRNRKKLFIAGIFVLLLMLAFGSMITFAKNGARTSYTLTIVKKLDLSNIPENERPSLSDLAYSFHITGAQGNNPPKPIDQQVTINNFNKTDDNHAEGSATVELGSSSAVSVIELTNTLDPDFVGYGVSGTSYVSHMHANNGYAEVTLSKEKNWLTISPSAPADGAKAIERIYRVTGPKFSKYYTIRDGGKQKIENLAPGNYVIEAVKAPDGFSVELNNPYIPVASGAADTASATVKINGNSGTATVTAGGTPGDEQIHHFVAEKVNDSSFREEFSLTSGETYRRDHLTQGEYILSARTFEGNPAFSVEMTSQPKKVSSGSATFSNPIKGSLPSFTLTGNLSETDFVRMFVSNIKPASAQKKYQIQVKTTAASMLKRNNNTGKFEPTNLNYLNSYSTNNPIPGDSFRLPVGPGKRFNFGFRSANPDPFNVASYKLNWTVYRPYSTDILTSDSGEKKVVNVYDDGYVDSPWIKISKTPDTDPAILENIKYNFTITDQTTNAKYTVSLGGKDGPWQQRFELPAGKYTVEQEMIQKDSSAFTVTVEDKQYTTDQKSSLTATVMGDHSTISLEKPADPGDPDRQYRPYRFKITGPSFPDGVEVALNVSESKKLRELLSGVVPNIPGEGGGYAPGDYTITPLDDNYVGFDLDYSDSCTVAIVGSPATVTITNKYAKVDGSYRVVHEYYADDGMTKLDGKSDIFQLFDGVFGTHTENEVTRLPNFTLPTNETYFYECKAFAYGDYGSYEPEPAAVSGNSPEMPLNAVIPDENPDVSGNDPAVKEPNIQSTDDAASDGQNPETDTSDVPNPDTENADGQNPGTGVSEEPAPDTTASDAQNPEAENTDGPDTDRQDPDTINPDGQTTVAPDSQSLPVDRASGGQEQDISNAGDRLSGEINSAAEFSVTGSSGSGKYQTGIASGRSSAPERFSNNAARSWYPGGRKSVAKTSAEKIPYIRNTVTENPNGQVSYDSGSVVDNSGTERLGGTVPDAGDSGEENPDINNLKTGTPAELTPDTGMTDVGSPDVMVPDATVSGNDIETAVTPPTRALAADNGNFTDDGSYKENSGYNNIQATPNGDKIIILKYVRRNIVITGSYKVVHRYYLRDSGGDHLEGIVMDPEVTGLPLDYKLEYTAEKDVQQKPRYSPQNGNITHTYTYDGAVYGSYTDDAGNTALQENYQPASGKNCVYATQNGDEVIVLRYVRTVSYNVVHEYYLRTPTDDAGTNSLADFVSPNLKSRTEKEAYTGNNGDSESDDTENSGDGTDNSDENTGINYQYDFEGRTRIETITGNLNETYTEARVNRIVRFRPQSATGEYHYTPFAYAYGELANGSDRGYTENSSMINAIATPGGDQVIIIKYYREPGSTPEPDPTPPPQPDPGPEPDDDHHRDPGPEPEPEIIPEPEPEPELPTELPDPNDPDSPEKITIMEDGVPRTYVKVWDPRIDEWVYIPEEEVPLWGFPATGDNSDSILWIILSAASFAGILFLWADRDKEIFPKKRN